MRRIIFNDTLSFIETKEKSWVAISKKEERYLPIKNKGIISILNSIEPLYNAPIDSSLKKEIEEIKEGCYMLLIVSLLNEVEIHLKENRNGQI